MINRVLIRIKVVQLLYSYLLSQSEFKIEPQIENPSRDKKYGYALYMDLMLLLIEMSGYDVTDGHRESIMHGLTLNKHLYHNQLGKALSGLPELRTMILHQKGDTKQFESIVPKLYQAISDLPAYKSYVRIKEPGMKDEVALWVSVITNLVSNNPEFLSVIRKHPDFTLAGFTRGVNMTLHTLNEFGDNRALLLHARNALDHSLDKAYELYHRLLQLGVEITRMQDLKLDNARHKFYPTDEDLHPNTRFVDNLYIKALTENEDFKTYVEDHKLTWDADDTLVRELLDLITSSELYDEYMDRKGEATLEQDADFWRSAYKNIILPSDALADVLENRSVYWNDDLHVMGTFVLKTIRKFAQSTDNGSDIRLLPQYKDNEDRNFGPDLFMNAIKHYSQYKELVEKYVNTTRWDADRLAFMDIVIMIAAITELLNYPAIPIAVTLNEYIEIANAYSTPRSGSFINGILYSVINHLKEEGKLLKE